MLQNEYSVIERANNDQHPLLTWNQPSIGAGHGTLVSIDAPLQLRVGDPIPREIEWVDYLNAPEPVISIRLAKVIANAKPLGTQLLPVHIKHPHDPFADPLHYVFLHVLNQFMALDRANSEIITNKAGDIIFSIDKLVLNEGILRTLPEEHRLIFELKEKPSVILVHDKLRALIESIQPTGIKFYKVPEWNSDVAFD